MWYVYILRSASSSEQEYTGSTQDLRQRVKDHNAGRSPHSSKYRPWELQWYCAFPEKWRALEFEKYLKSHSGRAFARKRLTIRPHSAGVNAARVIATSALEKDR